VLSPQWLRADRRAALIDEVRTEPNSSVWRRYSRALRILACALLGVVAYALVLTALALGEKISYVSPVREVSVVVGAWIGVRFMDEAGGALRVIASTLVASGIVLIALGG
jgi:uncharacterized membrane protein